MLVELGFFGFPQAVEIGKHVQFNGRIIPAGLCLPFQVVDNRFGMNFFLDVGVST